MRRRTTVLATAVAALALPAPAGAAVTGRFFPGDPIDAGVSRVGGLDLARDGGGGVVYLKQDGGVDHVYVSRTVNGGAQPPERVDGGLAGAASNPVIAASDGGRLAVAWETAGAVVGAVKPAAGQAWTGPQVLAAAGSAPAVDLGVNGVGYVTYTVPGGGGADVRASRVDRGATAFNSLDGVLDIAAADAAGTGTGRSRVSVAADGTAAVVWGEAGGAWMRRLLEYRQSAYPQPLGAGTDAPDIGLEDDSSFGWAVFRQGASAVARRLRGSTFDAPVDLGSGDAPGGPRIALGGRGDGYATWPGQTGQAVFGAVLKDDLFNRARPLGGGFGTPPDPVPAVSYTGDGVIAYQQGDGAGGRTIRARAYDVDPRSRLVTPPGAEAIVSRGDLPAPDADRGLVAGGDRAGDFLLSWVQGDRVVVAAFDRAPAAFRATSTTNFRRFAKPPLAWQAAADEWGPITYAIVVDGRTVGRVQDRTQTTSPVALKDGVHRWYLVATDRRGQSTRTPVRSLRVDATKPRLRVAVTRSGRLVGVSAKASDPGHGSGLRNVKIGWGDGSRTVVATRSSHRYGARGGTLRVTATDRAGNAAVFARRIA